MREEGGDPQAGPERAAGHGAGAVRAEGERDLGAQLVLPAAQQQVGERDADRVHVEEHLARRSLRLRDLLHTNAVGTGRGDHLYRAIHRTTQD